MLTPSPSDINMREASPCDAAATTTTPTTTSSTVEGEEDSVIERNQRNNNGCDGSYDDERSSSSPEDTELAREKFFRSLKDFEGESSSSLMQRTYSSARARNELLAFEDTTLSDLGTMCDNTYSEEREEEDALSITYEESSEDLNESSVRTNNKDCREENSSDNTTKAEAQAESLGFDTLDESDSQATKFEANLEIDGKYIKSLVNSKKSLKKSEDEEEEKAQKPEEPEAKPEDQQPVKKEIKFFEDDISYIKRLRLIINKPLETGNAGGEQKQQLQGSLDSINLKENDALELMRSKKSKSFESIKRQPQGFRSDVSGCESVSKARSHSGSQPVTATDLPPSEDFCTACSMLEQPSSTAEVFYTLRSNCSSPEDSATECDICSSCNLVRDNSSDAEQRPEEPSVCCEICGEPAEEPDGLPPRAGLPKAKSSIEIGRARMSVEDERFEIDNCGSLEAFNRGPVEPLYVNVAPRREALRFVPKDELAMSRSLSLSAAKRPSRKGSYLKKCAAERGQEKRRFSSADNLQNRMSFRTSGEKFCKSRESKFMTSADSIRPSRAGRSRSLRRSADNVGRFDSSGDNLDSLEENADTDENGACAAPVLRIRDSDTIKMILTKHGIKIISQKETVL